MVAPRMKLVMIVVLKFAESTSILGWSPDILCSTRGWWRLITSFLTIPQQEFGLSRGR
jgi:hypothetical protein